MKRSPAVPRLSWMAWMLVATAMASAQGQPEATVTSTSVESGGKTYVESIRLSPNRFSQALRFGAIKRGSETLDLGGKRLAKGTDYEIDYPSGTIYLKVPVQEGQQLRVNYRYDEEKGAAGSFGMAGTTSTSGFNGFKFDFAQGNSAFVGLGMTERLGDGTVLSSNVYGISNSFSLMPGTSLKGLFMVGQRDNTQSTDMLTGASNRSSVEEGQGRALIQSLESRVGKKGKFTAYFQDIDSRFGGFQALGANGYTGDQVGQLSREKGLKRTALGFDNIGTDSANISNSLQTVGDDNGTITRRTAAAEGKGFKLNWWSQDVDKGFTRFADIGAADWQQMGKERGFVREGMSGSLGFAGGQTQFSTLKLDSEQGGLARSSLGITAGRWKIGFSEQRVDQGFVRFGDLRGDEWNGAQLQHERGLLRRNYAIEGEVGKGQKVAASQGVVRTSDADFSSLDMTANLGKFSIEHINRTVDKGFNRLGSLGGDVNAHAAAALKVSSSANPQGHDIGAFLNSAGLERSSWRLGFNFDKGSSVSLHTSDIKGKDDKLGSKELNIKTPNLNLKVRDQKTGDKFSEVSRLMPSEHGVHGASAGLNRQDISGDMKLGGSRTLAFSKTSANDLGGDLSRETLSMRDKGLELDYKSRNVDSKFQGLGSFADPERDLFRALSGYKTQEGRLRWAPSKSLSIESDLWGWEEILGSKERFTERTLVRWQADKATSFEMLNTEHRFGDEFGDQVNQRGQKFTLGRDIASFGKLTLSQDAQTYDGSGEKNPDSLTRSVSFQAKLNPKTGFKTEQSETRFEDGTRTTVLSNTLSTDLTNRAGVSVTQTNVNRDGEKTDETHRQYGFWYDFGKGIKFNYGYQRALNGEEGSLNSKTELTSGTVQDVKIDSASYSQVRQDDRRDQTIGRFSLASAKAMNWGILQDVRFSFNADTHRDQYRWQRENRSMNFAASHDAMGFGFDYNSQVSPTGDRAIDRFFSFTTDRTNKADFVGSFRYGVRTLPTDQTVMIRDYSLAWKPADNVVFKHAVVTNALANQNGVLLGTVHTPLRSNIWSLDIQNSRSLKAGLFWKENQDEARFLRSREGGINLVLNANNPSPISLSYGVQQVDDRGTRKTAHKFGFIFNQRPGPNQSWNILFENLNWQHGRPENTLLQNWNARMDYSWRF
jgi:hypothetical protein